MKNELNWRKRFIEVQVFLEKEKYNDAKALLKSLTENENKYCAVEAQRKLATLEFNLSNFQESWTAIQNIDSQDSVIEDLILKIRLATKLNRPNQLIFVYQLYLDKYGTYEKTKKEILEVQFDLVEAAIELGIEEIAVNESKNIECVYMALPTVDNGFLGMRGIPFYFNFLILMNKMYQKFGLSGFQKWISLQRNQVDDFGKNEIDEFLFSLETESQNS